MANRITHLTELSAQDLVDLRDEPPTYEDAVRRIVVDKLADTYSDTKASIAAERLEMVLNAMPDPAAERMLQLNDRTEDAMTDIPLVQRDQQGRENVYAKDLGRTKTGAFDVLIDYSLYAFFFAVAIAAVWTAWKGPVGL